MAHLQVGVDVLGLDHVVRNMDELAQLARKPQVRKGLRRAGLHLRDVGRINLKSLTKGHGRQTGNLSRSMSVLVKRKNAGALAGFRRGQKGGNHAHLVDRGTAERYTRKGEYRGVMPANYFWTRTKLHEARRAGRFVIQALEDAVSDIR